MKKSDGLFRLLSPWRHRTPILLFCLGTMVAGLFCAGLGILAWDSTNRVFTALLGPQEARNDYIVMGKKADSLAFVDPKRNEFTPAQLAGIMEQGFVKSILPVEHTEIPVYLTMNLGGHQLGTQIFFESVDLSRLGPVPADWNWSPESPYVPIMLPRTFLALFNMGFAASRNLPAIHEDIISSVPLEITAQTTRGIVRFPARISALTDRFSSFLVPPAFLAELNGQHPQNPRRLVVKVDNIDNPKISSYLSSLNYEVHEGTTGLREAALVASLVSGFFLLLGLILWASSILSFFQYMSAWLALFTPTLETLLLLGHRRKHITRLFSRHMILLQVIVAVPAVLGLEALRDFLGPLLSPWLPTGSQNLTVLPLFLILAIVVIQQGIATMIFHLKLKGMAGSKMSSGQSGY